MKKEMPQKKAKKQYVKPELTKHKKLREVTMQLQYQAQCSVCGEEPN